MKLETIKNNILTQDNRCTDQPMFIVQKEVLEMGIDSGFADEFYYFDYDDCDCHGVFEGDEDYERYSEMDEDGSLPSTIQPHGFRRRWEFVQAFFTEAAATEYMEANSYHFNKARVYGWTSYRNEEFRAVRNAIINEKL